MTEYVILKATNEPGTIFAVEGEFRASGAIAAVRGYASEQGWEEDELILAAVPKRSWAVIKVVTEIKTTRKVTELL